MDEELYNRVETLLCQVTSPFGIYDLINAAYDKPNCSRETIYSIDYYDVLTQMVTEGKLVRVGSHCKVIFGKVEK